MKKLSKVEQLKLELKAARAIEDRNKKFNSLSKAEKRMFIAKDVIDSIKSKKLIAATGLYVRVNGNIDPFPLVNQDILCDSDTTCIVCGIGALFVSKVKIDNNFNSEIDSSDELRDILSTCFSRLQLALIEAAFEGWEVDYLGCNSYKLEEKCIEFHNKYSDDGDRMIAIMKNIISNKGLFKI